MSLHPHTLVSILLVSSSISVAAAPINDEIGGAIGLTGSGSFTENVSGATPSLAAQFGGSIENDVWFHFVGDGSVVTLSTRSPRTTYDTQFFLWGGYDGSHYSSLTQLLYDDDSGGGLTSFLTFASTPGAGYWLGIDGFAGASGTFELTYDVGNAGSVPVPASGLLVVTALGGMAGLSRRRLGAA